MAAKDKAIQMAAKAGKSILSGIAMHLIPILMPIILIIIFIAAIFISLVDVSAEIENREGTSFTEISGGDIHEKVWNALIDAGFTETQVAGVMGNIEIESTFNPGATNPNGGAMGLCQWMPQYLGQHLITYANDTETDWKNENLQINFIVAWLANTGPAVKYIDRTCGAIEGLPDYQFGDFYDVNAWRNYTGTDVKYATIAFYCNYEHGGPEQYSTKKRPERHEYAQDYYDKYHGTRTAGESSNSSGSSSGSGFWWPIGSATTTTKNGKTFASDSPEIPHGTRVSRGGRSKGWSSYDHIKGAGEALDIGGGTQNNHYNVIAMAKGTVERADDGYPNTGLNQDNGGMGNCVYIRYSNNILVRYMHLYPGSITVKVGDTVDYGQVVGKMGCSGESYGTHLHVDMWKGEANGGGGLDVAAYLDATNPRP